MIHGYRLYPWGIVFHLSNVFIYHFLFHKKLMLCCLPLYLISVHFSVFMTAFALYILIKCFSKHKCFYSYSSIMDYAFILSPSWETPITWDFLDPSFIEIVILLVFLFFFYAFYHICILLSCLLAICNLVLISVTIFSSLSSV